MRGLYFRKQNSVCLIYPCNCVHTFFFIKNIDVAFIDRKNIVIKVLCGVKP